MTGERIMVRNYRIKLGKKLAAAGLAICLAAGLLPATTLSAAAAGQDGFNMSATAPDGTEDWSKLRINLGNPEGNPEGSSGTPMGNGIFAAKENGGITEDIFPLNHSTFWSGDPKYKEDLWNGDASAYGGYGNTQATRQESYQKLKKLLADAYKEGIGEQERQNLMKQVDGLSKKVWNASSTSQASFLSMGKMKLSFPELNSGTSQYERILDMSCATSDISFKKGDVTYTRQSFISNPDQVMATRIVNSASEAMAMSVTLELPSAMAGKTPENKVTVDKEKNEVVMTGRAPYDMRVNNGVYGTWDNNRGILFEARVKVLLPEGGSIQADGNSLKVTGAGEIVLLYTCATSFKDANTDPSNSGVDYAGKVRTTLDLAAQKSYGELLNRHQQDFGPLFRRMWIDLDGSAITRTNGVSVSPFEYVRYYQYGRYFSLCAERENSMVPANLMGIWSSTWSPPNNGAFFLNENVEKMQAIRGAGNLTDTAGGLYRLLESVSAKENGQRTAVETYGAREGSWVVAHSTDIWAQTAMWGDDPQYSSWTSGGIWLMDTLYDKYDFTQDLELLKQYYPIMEGAARFALSTLMSVEGTKGELKDYLVIAPSGSPEHWFNLAGGRASFDISTACDVEVYQNLFHMMKSGAKVLEEAGETYDESLLAEVEQASAKMVPLTMFIDPQTGRMKEFYNEYTIGDPNHRHASHLLPLFLNHLGVNESDTPEVYYALQEEAVRLFSVGAGRHPDKMVMGVRAGLTDLSYAQADPSLSGAFLYGPLANYVGETILDSRFDEINLMEYIPNQWSSGTMKGMRARGGYQLSFRWEDGELTSCTIDSPTGGTPRVLYKGKGVNLAADSRFQVNRAPLSLEKLQAEAREKLDGKYTNESKDNLRTVLESGNASEISAALLALEPVTRPEQTEVTVTAANHKNVLTSAGETVQLTASASGGDARFRWSIESLEEGQDVKYIASIDSEGVVTAIGGGKVRVTALCLDGSGSEGSIDLMVELPVSQVTNIDDRDSRVNYETGRWSTWNEAKHMNGTITYSTAEGDKVSLTFSGTGIEFISSMGGHLGGFSVMIDGEVAEPSVILNTASKNQYLAFSKYDLSPGEHTITLTSLNINGRTRFDVDAFNVIHVKTPQTDRKALRDLYEQYLNLSNEGVYTQKSWENFQQAMSKADTMLQSFTCTQEEIDGALSTLDAAYNGLEIKGNTQELEGLIAECDALEQSDYTTQSWEEFQIILADVRKVLDDKDVAASVVQQQYNRLMEARLKLAPVPAAPEKKELMELISRADAIDPTNLRPEKLADLERALEEAKRVCEEPDVSIDEINKAADDLLEAIVNLKEIADRSYAAELAKLLSGLEAENYTPDSYERLCAAVALAEALNDDSDEAQISEAYLALQEAYGQLVRAAAPVDMRALKNTIKKTEFILANEDKFMPSSITGLEAELTKAQDICGLDGVTQQQVDEAVISLTAANARVRVREDRSVLFSAIQKAELYRAAAYTPESYAKLTAVLTQANTVILDGDAAREQIDQTTADIEQAIRELVAVGNEPVGNESVGNEPIGNESAGKEPAEGREDLPSGQEEKEENEELNNNQNGESSNPEALPPNLASDTSSNKSADQTARKGNTSQTVFGTQPDTKGGTDPVTQKADNAESTDTTDTENAAKGSDAAESTDYVPKEDKADETVTAAETVGETGMLKGEAEQGNQLPVTAAVAATVLVIALAGVVIWRKKKAGGQ